MAFTDEMHIRTTQIARGDDATVAPVVGDILLATSSGYVFKAISIPVTANFQNILGATTGDTTLDYKQHYDNTNPAALSTSAAAPGTSVISARRDHVHLLDVTAPHNLLSTAHGDTTASTVTRGDLVVGTGASPAWDDLPLGASGTYLGSDGTDALWRAQSTLDHGSLGGLSDDDHTQYALLAGRSGGQTLIGGTAAGDDLTLKSTSNGTKGTIFLGTASAYDEVNDSLGIGDTTPGTEGKLVIAAPGVSVDRQSLILVNGSQNNNGTDLYALFFTPTFAPDVNTNFAIGVFSTPIAAPSTGITLSVSSAMYSRIKTGSDAGTITQGRGLTIDATYGSQKPGTVYGIIIPDIGATGITTAIGIGISTPTNATNKYVFQFDADATDPTSGGGAATGRIPCLIGGTTRYLAYY